MTNSHRFERILHHHEPRNMNAVHEAEIRAAGFHQRLAVGITEATGSMWTAYLFTFLALLGFPALSTFLGPVVAIYVIWVSQTFIQLVMLPVLSVGQNVLGRKSELMADEQFQTTTKTYHDIEQIMEHLDHQDAQMEIITKQLASVMERLPQRRT